MQQQMKKTAIYCRLSKDDGTSAESVSIGTQKEMLTSYAKENGLFPVEYYVDDGFYGKNFERPDFQRMISDVKEGKISVCVTKDDYVIIGLNRIVNRKIC